MSGGDQRERFRVLHGSGALLVMPNPWDAGSARLLEGAGFPALATTSSGLAWSRGRDDYGVTREELLAHVADLVAAVGVPLNVDAERCFAEDADGVAETVRLLHEAGAAGCSIEDWDEAGGRSDDLAAAVERVAAAAEAAHHDPDDRLVLTARCEHLLHDRPDLDEVVARLVAYRDAGADCVYAPGLVTLADVRTVVEAVGVPVNVLLPPCEASLEELAAAGVRRVSTGGALASAAYGALVAAARGLADGSGLPAGPRLSPEDRRAFG